MTEKNLTDFSDESASSLSFEHAEQYYSLFERDGRNIEDAIAKLIADNTICSIYVLVQILGNPAICQRFGWRSPEVDDYKVYCGLFAGSLFEQIYTFLFSVIMHGRLMMKGIVEIPIYSLTIESFNEAFTSYTTRTERKRKRKERLAKTEPKGKRGVSTTSMGGIHIPSAPPRPTVKKEGKHYTDFEYGLSDW